MDYRHGSRSQSYQERYAQGNALTSSLFSCSPSSSPFPTHTRQVTNLFSFWFIFSVFPVHEWAETWIFFIFLSYTKSILLQILFTLCFLLTFNGTYTGNRSTSTQRDLCSLYTFFEKLFFLFQKQNYSCHQILKGVNAPHNIYKKPKVCNCQKLIFKPPN